MNQNGSYGNWNDEIVRHIKIKKDWKHLGNIRIWNNGERTVSARADATPEEKELSSFRQLRNGQRVWGENLETFRMQNSEFGLAVSNVS